MLALRRRELLTVSEVARWFGVSERTVFRAVQRVGAPSVGPVRTTLRQAQGERPPCNHTGFRRYGCRAVFHANFCESPNTPQQAQHWPQGDILWQSE